MYICIIDSSRNGFKLLQVDFHLTIFLRDYFQGENSLRKRGLMLYIAHYTPYILRNLTLNINVTFIVTNLKQYVDSSLLVLIKSGTVQPLIIRL